MQCVPPSKQASSRPQSQGNLEFLNPMSGRHWRRARVEKPDLVSDREGGTYPLSVHHDRQPRPSGDLPNGRLSAPTNPSARSTTFRSKRPYVGTCVQAICEGRTITCSNIVTETGFDSSWRAACTGAPLIVLFLLVRLGGFAADYFRGHPSALRAAGLSEARCGGLGEAEARPITIGEFDASRLGSGS